MANTFPLYVLNFRNAYENLYKLYLSNGTFALTDENGTETKEFIQYAKAVKEVIKVKMNTGGKKNNSDTEDTNQSSNRAMVESIRNSGEYNYYKINYPSNKKDALTANSNVGAEENEDLSDTAIESNESDASINNKIENDEVFIVDEVLDHLFTEILRKDIEKCYFISKADAQYAFNSITLCIHNELVNMCRKLPKPIPINPKEDSKAEYCNNRIAEDTSINSKACFKIVNLDDTFVDSEGNTTSLGAHIADPNRNTEDEAFRAAALEYGISSFVHEMVSYYIANNKPLYMISYLNTCAGGTAIELYEDIYNNGFDQALQTIVERLRNIGIHVEYLNNLHLNWKKNNKDIKKNYPNNWRDEAYKIVNARVAKKNIF